MQLIVQAAMDCIQEDMLSGEVPRVQISTCATIENQEFTLIPTFAIRALHGRVGWAQLDLCRTSYPIELNDRACNFDRCFVIET